MLNLAIFHYKMGSNVNVKLNSIWEEWLGHKNNCKLFISVLTIMHTFYIFDFLKFTVNNVLKICIFHYKMGSNVFFFFTFDLQ